MASLRPCQAENEICTEDNRKWIGFWRDHNLQPFCPSRTPKDAENQESWESQAMAVLPCTRVLRLWGWQGFFWFFFTGTKQYLISLQGGGRCVRLQHPRNDHAGTNPSCHNSGGQRWWSHIHRTQRLFLTSYRKGPPAWSSNSIHPGRTSCGLRSTCQHIWMKRGICQTHA